MNIENRRQLAIILLAVGLGLVAAFLMSRVVNDRVAQETQRLAEDYKGTQAAFMKEMDATKMALEQLAQEHNALAQRVAEQPPTIIQQAPPAPPPKKPEEKIFSLRTPPGKRAFTILIDSLSAVGGLINPGDFVDIIAHLNMPNDEGGVVPPPGDQAEKVTTVLFQDIQVLAVGTNFDPESADLSYEMQQKGGPLNVTLAVSPEESSLLTFAQRNGQMMLSLRSPLDSGGPVVQRVASWGSLSDFLLRSQGTDLKVPMKKATIEPAGPTEEVKEEEEPKPFIQIFRGGREL